MARERTAYKARRDALVTALRTSFAPEELTLAGLHTGLHLLAQLKDPPPDAALRAAARQYGVRCSLLSDYDLTGTAHSAAGTLVLGYGSLPDADCAAAGERLKKLWHRRPGGIRHRIVSACPVPGQGVGGDIHRLGAGG